MMKARSNPVPRCQWKFTGWLLGLYLMCTSDAQTTLTVSLACRDSLARSNGYASCSTADLADLPVCELKTPRDYKTLTDMKLCGAIELPRTAAVEVPVICAPMSNMYYCAEYRDTVGPRVNDTNMVDCPFTLQRVVTQSFTAFPGFR